MSHEHNMDVSFILPIKSFDQGKTRLRHVLSTDDRRKLNVLLSNHIISEISKLDLEHTILIVSSDPAVIDHATSRSLIGIIDTSSHPTLTTAVILAASHARHTLANWICYIPIDLPLLRTPELRRLINRAVDFDASLIVPSGDDSTTSLLLTPRSFEMEYQFGSMSCRHHMSSLLLAKRSFIVERSISLERDIDTPDDIEDIKANIATSMRNSSATEAQIEIFNILNRANLNINRTE